MKFIQPLLDVMLPHKAMAVRFRS